MLEEAPSSASASASALSDDMLNRMRMLVDALEDDGLREHASEGLRHLVSYEATAGVADGRSFEVLHTLVKELVDCATAPSSPSSSQQGGCDDGAKHRRRLESLRLISLAIESHRLQAVLPMLSHVLFRLADACASPAGGAAPVSNELAGCIGWVTRAVIEHHTMYEWTPLPGVGGVGGGPTSALPHRRSEAPWLSELVLHPFVASLGRARGVKTALFSASRCIYVALNEFLLKLEACREAAQDCIVYLVHLMHAGGDALLAGGAVFLPLQRAVEIVGIGSLRQQDVRVMVDCALRVMATASRADKGNDWGATVLAIQMLFVLAATTWSEEEARLAHMQKAQSVGKEGGAQAPGIDELYAFKLQILAALQEAKHDSVSNVRRIASETITEFKTVERIRLRVQASTLASAHKQRMVKFDERGSGTYMLSEARQTAMNADIGRGGAELDGAVDDATVTKSEPNTETHQRSSLDEKAADQDGKSGSSTKSNARRQARKMAELSRPRSSNPSGPSTTAGPLRRGGPTTPVSGSPGVEARPRSAGLAATASASRSAKHSASKTAATSAKRTRSAKTRRDVVARATPKQILPQFVANAPLVTDENDGAVGVSIFVPGSRAPVTNFDFNEGVEEATRRRGANGGGRSQANGLRRPADADVRPSDETAADAADTWIVNQTFEDAHHDTGPSRPPLETPLKSAFFDTYMSMSSEQPTPMPTHREDEDREGREDDGHAAATTAEKTPLAEEREDGQDGDGDRAQGRTAGETQVPGDQSEVVAAATAPPEGGEALVEFGKYGIDMDAHLSGVTDPAQRHAILTLASGHIKKMQTSYARRAKARIDALKQQHEDSVARLDAALHRDVDETRRATATAIQMDAKKFEAQLLPSLLQLLGSM